MSTGKMRGDGLRFGGFGGALVAAAGLLAGCEETSSFTGGDGGPDAATGFVSANTRGDGDGGAGGGDTDDFTVGIDTNKSADHLSVGIDSLDSDAGVTGVTSAPITSEPASTSVSSSPATDTTEPPAFTSETSSAPSSAERVTSVPPDPTSAVSSEVATSAPETSGPVDTSAPVDTSLPVDTTAVDTSSAAPETSAPVDTTAVETSAPLDTSAPVVVTSEPETSSAGETSAPLPPLEFAIAAEGTWVDLPATFRALNLPDINLTFAWSVVSVPQGSQITDASLSDVGASEVSFVPDVAGPYTLRLHLASGEASGDVEATVAIEKVDVGFLRITDGGDGYYSYEPLMISSDQSSEAVNVGCPSYSTEFGDSSYWLEVLADETRTIGFRYPEAPGEETLFAYHYRNATHDNSGVTHVATIDSDCANNPPVELQLGYSPDFSPTPKQLSRIGRGDGNYLMSSPIDVDEVVYPTSSSPVATDWQDDESIVWAGYIYNGDASGPAIAVSSTTSDESHVILNCAIGGALFEQFDRVQVVPGGLVVLAYSSLWYLPVMTDEESRPYASCDYFFEGNVQIAYSVADFEVAPDGATLALITRQYYQDAPFTYLAVGPVKDPFDTENPAWHAIDLGSFDDYYFSYAFTGLHWVADSQQLVWTTVQYEQWESDGYYFANIFNSSVQKINADGSYRRTLVYESPSDTGGPERVATTGPLDIVYGLYGGGS